MKDLKATCACGSTEKFLRKGGAHTGLFCSNCGRWFKWLGKKVVEQYQRDFHMKVYPEHYQPPGQHAVNPPYVHPATPSSASFDERVAVPHVVDENYVSPSPEDLSVFEPDMYSEVQHPPHVVPVSEPCQLCLSQVMESVVNNKQVIATFYERVFTVITADRSRILASFKFKYCPSCGRKL